MSNANQTTNATQAEGSNYFNLHTNGIGYANRARDIKPKKGESFMAVSISGMFGEKNVKDGISYVPYDVKAVTAQAEDVLRQFMADINDQDKKVLVRFQIGDAYIDSFTYSNGPKAGQMGMTMKGRLLKVTHVWVKDAGQDDGKNVLVYDLAAIQAAQAASQDAPERSGTQG